ncbi:LysR family transcriptional regulator [Isobaculum melis]|uniref:DNA-binding transcriptional regulator, LysR family n=1 Tax=Isobaculum melis TaxID=142588 RepID=A0A1H9QT47_9LACT|nr:LysR family transcriptional regulator [Isobaculum melis]SER63642.1 DNA-binding transcriptional regulator, LysR family [Isobaculum melis]
MDIKQLKYFVTIVHSNNNLSIAAKKMHLSQPALSKMIKTFEAEENVELFIRKQGRISSLTSVGEAFYEQALDVIATYDEMMRQLEEKNSLIQGKIVIGIPPLILSLVFAHFISTFILKHPEIKIEIVEAGAHELKKMLLVNEIDLAILLQPTEIANIEEYVIVEDELDAFMSIQHPLAQQKMISWEQLAKAPLALFDDTFMINHLVMSYFQKLNLKPNVKIQSGAWDFLLKTTLETDFITILPAPIKDFVQQKDYQALGIQHPLSWKVTVCRQKKANYLHSEDFVLEEILQYFEHGVDE